MNSREKPVPREISAPGANVDRSAIRRLLALTYAERARLAVEEARNLQLFDQRARRQ